MEDFDPMEESGTGYESTQFMDPYEGYTLGEFEEEFNRTYKYRKEEKSFNDFYKKFQNPKGEIIGEKEDGSIVKREKFNPNTPLRDFMDFAKERSESGFGGHKPFFKKMRRMVNEKLGIFEPASEPILKLKMEDLPLDVVAPEIAAELPSGSEGITVREWIQTNINFGDEVAVNKVIDQVKMLNEKVDQAPINRPALNESPTQTLVKKVLSPDPKFIQSLREYNGVMNFSVERQFNIEEERPGHLVETLRMLESEKGYWNGLMDDGVEGVIKERSESAIERIEKNMKEIRSRKGWAEDYIPEPVEIETISSFKEKTSELFSIDEEYETESGMERFNIITKNDQISKALSNSIENSDLVVPNEELFDYIVKNKLTMSKSGRGIMYRGKDGTSTLVILKVDGKWRFIKREEAPLNAEGINEFRSLLKESIPIDNEWDTNINWLEDLRRKSTSAWTSRFSNKAVRIAGDMESEGVDPQNIKDQMQEVIDRERTTIQNENFNPDAEEGEGLADLEDTLADVRGAENVADAADTISETHESIRDARESDAESRSWVDLLKKIKTLLIENALTAAMVSALVYLLASLIKLKEGFAKAKATLKKVADAVAKAGKESAPILAALATIIANGLKFAGNVIAFFGKNLWAAFLAVGALILLLARERKK